MEMATLLKVLDASLTSYEYAGSKEKEIYGVQIQNGSYPYLDGMLYFQDSLSHPTPPQNVCVISGDRNLYETIQRIILDYSRKESLLIKMQDQLSAYRSSETEMISGIMGNPSIILREDYKPLVWNGFAGEEDFPWISEIPCKETQKRSEELHVYIQEMSDQVPFTFMVVPYTNSRGKRRYCVLVERETKFDRVIDPIFLEKICNTLQCYTFTNTGVVQPVSRLEELIKNMLYTVPAQPEKMKNELGKAGWIDREKYYVLLIDVSFGKTSANDMEELSRRLKARVFAHENYYVCLMTGTYDVEYDSRTDLGILDFLEERNFYAGLSYGFFDIVKISVAYKQALEAIKVLLDTLKGVRYYAFAEDIVTYLVKTSASVGELPMEGLCHPDVYRIYEYDQKYDSDYLNFLRVFIYSGGSVKRTAEAMFIHKNTVYQKIEKLKEYFHIDVNDLYAYVKIYVSLVIFEQMTSGNPNEFLRWM